jgi:hypothetical protein
MRSDYSGGMGTAVSQLVTHLDIHAIGRCPWCLSVGRSELL